MDNIRTESFLGGDKVIVGNKYTDLVLETLGKVYIKTGNSSRVLSDVLALLDKVTESEIKSQTIIVGSLLEMEQMEYPGDGFFVYNTLTTTLYISYDERYIALIEAAEGAGDGYVRRKGDTMTGQLEINTVGPPLIVASSKLVNNLNAEFIGGYAADDLAKKRVDEYITGNWTFKGKGVSENNWTFNQNVRMYGDLVTSGSLTSPEFASGFGGYGWRLDADTNTLTVDYLVVRKAMRVYEMVINKISATNGSLWVSNSSKCTAAYQPKIITQNDLSGIGTWGTEDAKSNLEKLMPSNNYFLFNDLKSNYTVTETFTTELANASGSYTAKSFVDYNFIIYIKDITVVINSPLFKGTSSLYDLNVLDKSWEEYSASNPGSGITEKEFNTYKGNIKVIFITKSREVTEWDTEGEGPLAGTVPKKWANIDTFNKRTKFFMVPKSREVNYKKDGKTSSDGSNLYCVYPYYKYFGLEGSSSKLPSVSNIWIVECKNEDYPYFKPGDIIRCQKYNNGNIKYYDAIVTSQVDSYTYIMQKALSVFDVYTEYHYDDEGKLTDFEQSYNDTQYNKTETLYNSNTNEYEPARTTDNGTADGNATAKEDRLDDIAKDDDMVQMGNIYNIERQNAVYITSTDDCGPYIDVLSGLNRPDYSALYITPTWATKKANIKKKGDIYVRESASDFYYQTVNPGSVNPDNFGGTIDKKHPLIFLQTKDSNLVLINDGENTQITQDILNNPAEYGYFLTEVPTMDSAIVLRDKEYKCTYTKITRVRLGNLSGIRNEIFGTKQPYGYGLYGENVFLTGEFYLNNGTSVIDFSEESVLLKFRNAGLEIRDVVNADGTIDQVPALNLEGEPILDENGNPTYRNKTEIYMNADQFVFNIAGNPAMKLSGLFNDKGQFQEALLDINGWVQSRGLSIRGDEKSYRTPYTPRPDLGTGIYTDTNGDYVTEEGYYINSFINTKGNLYARDGYFKGKIYATSGYFSGEINAQSGQIGSFIIKEAQYSWGEDMYVLYQKGDPYNPLVKWKGFKLGVGNMPLFDGRGAFLEVYNEANFISDANYGIGIKSTGHLNAAIWASICSLSSNKYPKIPNEKLMVAGFFDGGLYCTGSVHLGNFVTTTCNSQYSGSGVMYWTNSANNQDEPIVDVSSKGTTSNPEAGKVYAGVTFNGGAVNLDKVRFVVVNGLIVGVYKE
ncbi:MAG: hypothetical protein ACLU9M_07370 [Lachnospirales bacterium]